MSKSLYFSGLQLTMDKMRRCVRTFLALTLGTVADGKKPQPVFLDFLLSQRH